ncbi:MAG: hypothetical protein JXR70_04335 [Spirochaetales bacterium]|nr:hypothetical protein [Spirochaetales bacterium]
MKAKILLFILLLIFPHILQADDKESYFEIFLDNSFKFYSRLSYNIGLNFVIFETQHTNNWIYHIIEGVKISYDVKNNIMCLAYNKSASSMSFMGIEIPIITDFKTINIGISLATGLGLGRLNIYGKYNLYTDFAYNCFEIGMNFSVAQKIWDLQK